MADFSELIELLEKQLAAVLDAHKAAEATSLHSGNTTQEPKETTSDGSPAGSKTPGDAATAEGTEATEEASAVPR